MLVLLWRLQGVRWYGGGKATEILASARKSVRGCAVLPRATEPRLGLLVVLLLLLVLLLVELVLLLVVLLVVLLLVEFRPDAADL